MPQPRNDERLTKRTVDRAQPAAARYVVWDRDLKGFGLRVEPSGVKTFIVRYRLGGGRRGALKQFKIGRYGKLTPDIAREKALAALAAAELGGDPQAERTDARATLTVAELCDLYLEDGVASKKASTLNLDKIRIARHIKPLIGTRRITGLTVADVERLCRDITTGRVRNRETPHTRGGPGAASRTIGLLGGIFEFAVHRGLCSKNPTRGVRRPADVKRDRILTPDEVKHLGTVLSDTEAKSSRPQHIAILRLLLLTGARKNEIARLRWAEVDLGQGLLRLDDSKTGRHVKVISELAQKVLAAQARTASPFVFPDPEHQYEPVRGLDWAWVGIRDRAGMPDLRIHDLRHAFASFGVSLGVPLYTVGGLLGHTDHASTSRYAKVLDDPLRSAANEIAAPIGAALELGASEGVRYRPANDSTRSRV
jgi:integrase